MTLTAVPSITVRGRGRDQRLAHGKRVRFWHPFKHPRIPPGPAVPRESSLPAGSGSPLRCPAHAVAGPAGLMVWGAAFLCSSPSARPLPPGSPLAAACPLPAGRGWELCGPAEACGARRELFPLISLLFLPLSPSFFRDSEMPLGVPQAVG